MSTRLILMLTLLILLTACAPAAQPGPAESEMAEIDLPPIRLGTSYIPDVQFTPFYVAQEMGFYADEGLIVELEYGFENDFVALAAQGEREFAIASGDQVILSRAQGLPLTYVMKWYQDYPVALAAPADADITALGDLQGQTVGLPGFFGATFVGWKALVYAGGIDEQAVTLEEIGFTQAAALQEGVVDAAMVYYANEPTQLRSQGTEVNVIRVSDYINLVSNGLVVGEELLEENPELVGKMVRATLRGLDYTLNNPDEAFAITRSIVPEITDETAPTQREILAASIELWRSDRPGYSDPAAWQTSLEFMQEAGLLDGAVDLATLYTNEFIPEP